MVTSFPKQPILPGQTGVITYYYDSYRIGVFQKSLTVYSNAKTPSVVLKTCGQIYDPSSPDTYSSKSYTNCNCGQKTYTSSEQIVSKKTDSTSVSPTITINVYPNPSSSQTTIQADKNLTNATLTVYNLSGQQVKEIKNISGQTVTLFRDNLPSGLYFIYLTQDSAVISTKKLVLTD